jgi:hypothetical protein
MMRNKPIFGLRFEVSEESSPTPEEISVFLESPKKEGRRELHGLDLARYNELLDDILAFDLHQQQKAGPQDLRERMFYEVLSHSCFFNTALKSAVEQYKYYVHELTTLNFRKPMAFIKTAKEEMGRLNPKKRNDAAKLARLQNMVDERERTIEALLRRRASLADELNYLARYIRDNLSEIAKLCGTSISILRDLKTGGQEERRLIDEIKTYFKDQLKYALHQGAITKQDLETAKKDVAALSSEVSAFLREDSDALIHLYEAIRDHIKKNVLEIDALLVKIDGKKNKDFEEFDRLFTLVELVLVSLISDYHFELDVKPSHTETAHEHILLEKRKENLNHIFEVLQKERRSRSPRRKVAERRKPRDPNYKGPERRTGKDKRTGKKIRAK